jgi:hypothetical protein
MAIHNDRHEFVKSFLDNGLVLSKFLTYRCLIKLYNEVSCRLIKFNNLSFENASFFSSDTKGVAIFHALHAIPEAEDPKEGSKRYYNQIERRGPDLAESPRQLLHARVFEVSVQSAAVQGLHATP